MNKNKVLKVVSVTDNFHENSATVVVFRERCHHLYTLNTTRYLSFMLALAGHAIDNPDAVEPPYLRRVTVYRFKK